MVELASGLEDWVTIRELASSKGVHYSTVRSWMEKHRVPYKRVGPAKLFMRRIAEAVVDANLPGYQYTRRSPHEADPR